MSDTIAAIVTGAQVAAIGIIRLSGDEAISMADALFRPFSGKSIADHPDRKLVYGNLCDRAGELLDVCLCTVSRAPNSYTGENTVEFQCHGSPVVLRAALEELFQLGARQAGPGEFTKRAFLNGRMELSAAEAVVDIIDAESIEAAKNAAGQLSGAIGVKIGKIYSLLTDISSHYHAVLDYPDEDIEDFRLLSYKESLTGALDSLRALLSTFARGRLMNTGLPTAIVGKPNVGKSSLLNALLGYDRAIVTDIPGTTRDTVQERLRLGSVTLRLTDTAGIRATDDVVEQLGVERSRAAMEEAELVLALLDVSRPLTAEDQEILQAALAARNALLVLNKCDLPALWEVSALGQAGKALPILRLSAVTGQGLEDLKDTVETMFPLPAVPAGEILTNARQAEAVRRATDYMQAALEAMDLGATPDIVLTETEGAMAALGELDGRTVREDVTERIFSRFCVGK